RKPKNNPLLLSLPRPCGRSGGRATENDFPRASATARGLRSAYPPSRTHSSSVSPAQAGHPVSQGGNRVRTPRVGKIASHAVAHADAHRHAIPAFAGTSFAHPT